MKLAGPVMAITSIYSPLGVFTSLHTMLYSRALNSLAGFLIEPAYGEVD